MVAFSCLISTRLFWRYAPAPLHLRVQL